MVYSFKLCLSGMKQQKNVVLLKCLHLCRLQPTSSEQGKPKLLSEDQETLILMCIKHKIKYKYSQKNLH